MHYIPRRRDAFHSEERLYMKISAVPLTSTSRFLHRTTQTHWGTTARYLTPSSLQRQTARPPRTSSTVRLHSKPRCHAHLDGERAAGTRSRSLSEILSQQGKRHRKQIRKYIREIEKSHHIGISQDHPGKEKQRQQIHEQYSTRQAKGQRSDTTFYTYVHREGLRGRFYKTGKKFAITL